MNYLYATEELLEEEGQLLLFVELDPEPESIEINLMMIEIGLTIKR